MLKIQFVNQYSDTQHTIHPFGTIEKINNLVVIVYTKLSFDDHINQVVNKATKMTNIICRTFQFLDKDAFMPLYKTMVRTHLNYSNMVPLQKTHYCNRKRSKKSSQRITRYEKHNLYRKIKITETSHISI